jgi:hypothetical protein
MPYASEKQARFFNSKAGRKKIGAVKVNEFNQTTEAAGKFGWGKDDKKKPAKKKKAKK